MSEKQQDVFACHEQGSSIEEIGFLAASPLKEARVWIFLSLIIWTFHLACLTTTPYPVGDVPTIVFFGGFLCWVVAVGRFLLVWISAIGRNRLQSIAWALFSDVQENPLTFWGGIVVSFPGVIFSVRLVSKVFLR